MTDEFVNDLLGQIDNFNQVSEEKDRMIATLNKQAAALSQKSEAMAQENVRLRRQNEEMKANAQINNEEGKEEE